MRVLGWILVGAAAVATPMLVGCAEQSYVSAEGPPMPRDEIVAARTGFVWVHGHWLYAAGDWRWSPGYYAAERPGKIFVEGRWEHRGRGFVWTAGDWRDERDSVVTREPNGRPPPKVGQP